MDESKKITSSLLLTADSNWVGSPTRGSQGGIKVKKESNNILLWFEINVAQTLQDQDNQCDWVVKASWLVSQTVKNVRMVALRHPNTYSWLEKDSDKYNMFL